MGFKIWLSPPHIKDTPLANLLKAFESNELSHFGENTINFKTVLENYLEYRHVSLVSSGTAAIHLALLSLGIKKGDYVLCQSNTFIASANPIVYLNAEPIFIDSERDTWNICPNLLEEALYDLAKKGIKPKAIVAVALYGMPYKHDSIKKIAKNFDIPIIEDSAEALGSTYKKRKCGTLGDISIFSFNTNKIITTSGGGALVSNNSKVIKKADYLANQAKTEAPFLWHEELGYNYKLSNLLAGIGLTQMQSLDEFIDKRRLIFDYYASSLKSINAKIGFQLESKNRFSNRWLSCFTFESYNLKERVRKRLINEGIECRNLWNPLHKQPIFQHYLNYLNGVSEDLFNRGLCLPSGSNLSDAELKEITELIKSELS
jgi:dTDP-4-amino-4,6-dideoxygalactose transaminase